jgi:hypothetical protein
MPRDHRVDEEPQRPTAWTQPLRATLSRCQQQDAVHCGVTASVSENPGMKTVFCR